MDGMKQALLSVLPGGVVLVLAGLGCYLIALWVIRRRPVRALLPGLVLSLAMEGWDIAAHYGVSGFFAVPAAEMAGIVARHMTDVVLFNAVPALVALYLRRRRRT